MLGSRTGELLSGRVFSMVLTSPLQRASRTAQLAGLVRAYAEKMTPVDLGAQKVRATGAK